MPWSDAAPLDRLIGERGGHVGQSRASSSSTGSGESKPGISRRVHSDADRDRIRAFFEANADDSTGFPVLSRREDRELGIPGLYRVIEDNEGAIDAAIYMSGNPEDAMIWRQRGLHDLAEMISVQMVVIHTVAVRRKARRRGLGSALVRAARDDARGSNASVVALAFDDTVGGLQSFYEGLGFTVLPRRVNLALHFDAWPAGPIRFPQDNPTYRWAVQIVKSGAAQVVPAD